MAYILIGFCGFSSLALLFYLLVALIRDNDEAIEELAGREED